MRLKLVHGEILPWETKCSIGKKFLHWGVACLNLFDSIEDSDWSLEIKKKLKN